MGAWPGLIRAYHDYLDVPDEHVVTLHEGNTPLIPVPGVAERVGRAVKVYVKFDGMNPTGSFKDRGMTMAISKAKQDGSKAVICASTGNTSAAAAAYATRAGMKCYVLIPDGKIALGKLSQAMMHGATVLQVHGNFDDALKLVIKISREHPVTLVNSINPHRIQGQKTVAFEVIEQLGGKAPDYHFLPVGNAGNITAHWMGYTEWHKLGRVESRPKMMGFQAAGAAPIVLGHPVEHPETIATAIRIGNPASWKQAEAARDESGGTIDMVTDEEIIAAYQHLAGREGVFCEPASAASVAGLFKYADKLGLSGGETIVCTLTGHGLKDPDRAIAVSPQPTKVQATEEAVLAAMELTE
ncbi:MAG: threonine synthase [Deltaproteobacteria bacterium]|nr:threonine synthase [Deltaproteobacteria bacterium]